MTAHLLDRPAWTALTTRQRAVAIGGDHARRFAPDIGPLAAARDDDAASLAALADLVATTGNVLLLQADPIVIPPGLVALTTAPGVQMLGEHLTPAPADPRIEPLTDADAPAMLELATLTRPGPFAARTHTLGAFWGIRDHGALVAMAGERMQQPGFAEVSGVCTHPAARGTGLARLLSAFVAARIRARGDTPYLHAYTTNTAAIRLYTALGFRIRTSVHVVLLAAVDSAPRP